jgi:class 3 adenylate cyclase/ferredoxin
MRCPKCMAENSPTRRFCAQCGAPLPSPCPACGFENELTARFCGGCGKLIGSADTPAPAAVSAPQRTDGAERRQLTVMFCDLVGSTALAARLDPEDLREIIGAYHRAVAENVSAFDGFVAKYMGDGVLVYLGYPRAHEDDAERVVRAGLRVIDAVDRLDVGSVKLHARVGIATGLVVVGDLIGEGAAQEQSVVGEIPNLAARLQTLAEPDTVVIAASTRRLVAGRSSKPAPVPARRRCVRGPRGLGVSSNRIHTEIFGARQSLTPGIAATPQKLPHLPTGPAGSGPFVSFARSGLNVRWGPPFQSLLELAEACDVPVRWSCRTHVCHNCETALVAGAVSYHFDPVDPPAINNVLICCSQPEADIVIDL